MKFIVMILMFLVLTVEDSFATIPSFAPFQEILTLHVKDKSLPGGGYESGFDYEKAKNPNVQAKINEQMSILDKFKIKNIASKEEAMAFWINTYNFFMISKILKDGFKDNHLKIKSVKDLGSFFSPYKAFKNKDFKVSGQLMTLDQIEKEILLGDKYKKLKWKDARIHFAINCASVGCPPIRKNIYTPKDINTILDQNVKMAFKTKRHFEFSDKSLQVTSLFKWYKDDFSSEKGTVQNWIGQFIDNKALKQKVHSIKQIDYIDYDWTLNLPKHFGL